MEGDLSDQGDALVRNPLLHVLEGLPIAGKVNTISGLKIFYLVSRKTISFQANMIFLNILIYSKKYSCLTYSLGTESQLGSALCHFMEFWARRSEKVALLTEGCGYLKIWSNKIINLKSKKIIRFKKNNNNLSQIFELDARQLREITDEAFFSVLQ